MPRLRPYNNGGRDGTDGPLQLQGDGLHCEQVPLERIARRSAPGLRLFDGGHGGQARALRAASRRSRAADRLCGQGQSERRGARHPGRGRARRRLAPAANMRGGRLESAGEDRFSGSADGRGDGARVAAGFASSNLESLAEPRCCPSSRFRWDGRRRRLRVNPTSRRDPRENSTGAAHNKFGIPICGAPAAYARARELPGLDPIGVAVHIGSQLTSLAPLKAAFEKLGGLIRALRADGHNIRNADLGGGLGVAHDPAEFPPPTPADYGAMVVRVAGDWGLRLIFEPGRLIVGNAGVLLTRVIRVKPGPDRPFVILDAAMNDLMRPTLYDAWHAIDAVRPTGERIVADVVGPICESGDTFAVAREIDRVAEGDLMIIRTAGAMPRLWPALTIPALLPPRCSSTARIGPWCGNGQNPRRADLCGQASTLAPLALSSAHAKGDFDEIWPFAGACGCCASFCATRASATGRSAAPRGRSRPPLRPCRGDRDRPGTDRHQPGRALYSRFQPSSSPAAAFAR